MKKYFQEKGKSYRGLVMVLGLLFITGCGRQEQAYQKVDTAMGTIISQTLYGTRQDTEAASEELFAEIQRLETDILSRRLETSEIYELNKMAGFQEPREMSAILAAALKQCQAVYEASDGAFDITLGNVVDLWDIDARAAYSLVGESKEGGIHPYQLPTEEQLKAALENTGFDRISLTEGQIILPKGMQLDMGAVGKGIVLDRMVDILTKYDVKGAVISAGGSILTYGEKPEGSTWNVGIVNPMDTSENIGVLMLPGGCCVSTSGDYERYVEVDGIRYHHILNPKTGYPGDSGLKSVTILFAEDGEHKGLLSDALSTACFVLGREQGLKLVRSFGAEALVVDDRGEIFMTEGMEKYFYLSNGVK